MPKIIGWTPKCLSFPTDHEYLMQQLIIRYSNAQQCSPFQMQEIQVCSRVFIAGNPEWVARKARNCCQEISGLCDCDPCCGHSNKASRNQ